MTASHAPSGQLRAVTVRLAPGAGRTDTIDAFSLSADHGILFADPERCFAGVGEAAALELPGGLADHDAVADVTRRLAAVPHQAGNGGPVPPLTAHGALHFDPGAPARLVLPEIIYRREAGAEWVTFVGTDPPELDAAQCRKLLVGMAPERVADPDPGTRPEEEPRTVTLHDRPPPSTYAHNVARALEAIGTSRLRKVVLGRWLDVELDAPVAIAPILRRLHAQEPACTAFAHPTENGRFLGNSPELLVARRGRHVVCHPLAGTVGLGDAGIVERFLSSAKDREEHRVMVEEIVAGLRPLTEDLEVPSEPSLVKLRSLGFFGTRLEGRLSGEHGDPPSVLDLVAALHPTPAVGGVPRSEALALLASLEGEPRGHWAGPVGWTDARGDGDWVIGIRSLSVAGTSAHICAGAGIVSGSDPAAELAETTIKIAPVLDALAPGAGERLC